MGVSSTPVGAATTTPPTNDWEGFGQSMHGEPRAYRTLFGKNHRGERTDNSPSLFLLIRVSEKEDFQVSLESDTE
jgi:hypothetical protein